jgi:hypothetical protein
MALRSCYVTCAPCDGKGCRACTDGVTFARAAVTLARSSWCEAAPGVFGYLDAAKRLRARTGWDIVACCELIRHVALGEGVHTSSQRAA